MWMPWIAAETETISTRLANAIRSAPRQKKYGYRAGLIILAVETGVEPAIRLSPETRLVVLRATVTVSAKLHCALG